MRKGIEYLILGLMLFVLGCSKEPTNPDGDSMVSLDTVSVRLMLDVDKILSPLVATSTNFKGDEWGDATNVGQSRSMRIEMLNGEPQTRVVAENTIANLWILQYNGMLPTSKLLSKQYFDTYTALNKYPLAKVDGCRIVVIANSYNASLVTDVVGTATYQTQLNRGVTVANEQSLLTNNASAIPMSGDVEIDVTVEDEIVEIKLRRNVARVVMKVKFGDIALVGTAWTVQMAGVPNISYWMPHRSSPTFPIATPTVITYTAQSAVFSMTDYVEFSWYVPVNRRGKVQGTTPATRVTKAPLGATNVVLKGKVGTTDMIYTIYLGANFSVDYNIAPNYKYTYKIELYSSSSK